MASPADDPIIVRVAGREHRDWTAYSIDSDLMTPADAWRVSLGIPAGNIPSDVRPWAKVEVALGGDVILTGRIDRVERELAKDTQSLSLSGRDNAAVLVDCSAPLFTQREATLAEVADLVARPLGLERIEVRTVGRQKKVEVEPGMTAWDALKQACEANGCWAWCEPDGTLVIGGPDYTKLLLRGNDLADASLSARAVTNHGGVTVVNAPGGHPYASVAGCFNGSSQFLSTVSASDLQLGNSDFTIRGFVSFSSVAGRQVLLAKWDNTANNLREWAVWLEASTLYFYWSVDGSNASYVQWPWNPTINVFSFVQISRSSGQLYFYVNAAQINAAQPCPATFFSGSAALLIGAYGTVASPGAYCNGLLIDWEVAKGVNRPATVPASRITADSYTKLLLHMDTPGAEFTDSSETGKAVSASGSATQRYLPPGPKALNLNDTSQYLTTPNAADMFIADKDFTFDCWIKPLAATVGMIFSLNQPSPGALDVCMLSGNFTLRSSTSNAAWTGTLTNITLATVLLNLWQHIALVRRGSSWAFYRDGVSMWTATCADTLVLPTQTHKIGWDGGSAYVTGQIANLRFSLGIARWTKNFIPPSRYY